MPTGILSLGTIATRLRAAADSSALPRNVIEDLAACAQTLEGGFPSTTQLRAIAKVVADVAPTIDEPPFYRCVTSMDYWVTYSQQGPKSKPRADMGKPQWMLDNEANDEAVAAPTITSGIPDWMTEIVARAQAEGAPIDYVIDNRDRRDALLTLRAQTVMAQVMLDTVLVSIDNLLGE